MRNLNMLDQVLNYENLAIANFLIDKILKQSHIIDKDIEQYLKNNEGYASFNKYKS